MKVNLENLHVVIPAKNEGQRIKPVLVKLQMLGIQNIIVVNDGSSDDTEKVVSSFENVVVLNHTINLGPGAATLTGIKYAVKAGAELVATLDADDQHNPNNLHNLVDYLRKESCDLVIGSRFMKYNEIPLTRLFYNFFGNLISFLVTGIYLSDSQSGMKVMNRSFADKLNLSFDGFEFCIEIIKQAQIHKIKVGEIPIDVKYTKDTLSKGQNFQTGLGMLLKLFNPFD